MADIRAKFIDGLKLITGTIFNQGESDEVRALHTAPVTSDGVLVNPATEDGNLAKLIPATSFVTGRKTITTATTPEQITATSTPVKYVTIQALSANVGAIAIGHANTVRASPTASINGITLEAGDAYPVDVNNLNKIWIDASVNGEGITYAYSV